jgi:hypothetical protein
MDDYWSKRFRGEKTRERRKQLVLKEIADEQERLREAGNLRYIFPRVCNQLGNV